MLELLKIVFLGKVILLSPTYIDISNNQPFIYKKRLSIVNKGANVEIDLTRSNVKNILALNGIVNRDSYKKLDSFLKKCPIKVYGINKNKKIFFTPPYFSTSSKEGVSLHFSLDDTTDIQNIEELHIEPSCLLDHVKVYWRNYSM
jgi:hypothetical protein